MKNIFLSLLIFAVVAVGWFFINDKTRESNIPTDLNQKINEIEISPKGEKPSFSGEIINSDNLKNTSMKIKSSSFENNQYIPSKYTCDGANVSPSLFISGAPAEAKSLVLIVDDPDAPKGDWVHWTVFNIMPDTEEIKEGKVPAGSIEGKTDFRNPGYGGPCPPSGTHHYQFKFYALDTTLNLDASAGKKEIEEAMEGHILAQDLLVGLYKRK